MRPAITALALFLLESSSSRISGSNSWSDLAPSKPSTHSMALAELRYMVHSARGSPCPETLTVMSGLMGTKESHILHDSLTPSGVYPSETASR